MRSLVAVVACALAAGWLCRFTVRDVAFVDLGDPPHRLIAFVSETDTPGVGARLRTLARASLTDANVEFEVVDPDEDGDHRSFGLLAEHRVQTFPAAFLELADGLVLELPIRTDDGALDPLALEAVVSSPARAALRDALLERFAVVVVALSGDRDSDDGALGAVDTAFAALDEIFDRMPKAVGRPPVRVLVPPEARGDERVLLASLGLSAPGAAVVFGRGRRVGPPALGDALTAEFLFTVLANAGRSCECGLDRSWMQGPRVPLRWDAQLREQAVAVLGFDPDSPLTRAEVASILGKERPAAASDDPLLGYAELVVDDDGEARALTIDDLRARFVAENPEPPAPWRPLLTVAVGFGLLALGAGAILLARSRRA